jgi:hypothetical protein
VGRGVRVGRDVAVGVVVGLAVGDGVGVGDGIRVGIGAFVRIGVAVGVAVAVVVVVGLVLRVGVRDGTVGARVTTVDGGVSVGVGLASPVGGGGKGWYPLSRMASLMISGRNGANPPRGKRSGL